MPDNTEKINSLAVDILNLSRNTLVINLRFMDKAISMLEFKNIPGLGGVAVDGVSIYYDPVFVLNSFSSERTKTARQYLHMVLHCVYQHFWVSTLVNQEYWDLACDIAVEYTINDIGITAVETSTATEQVKVIEQLKSKVKSLKQESRGCPKKKSIANKPPN